MLWRLSTILLLAPFLAYAQEGGSSAIGGITQLTADCTAGPGVGSAPIACTKTAGTPFAPSATTDTTNATNITSGTVNMARMPTGIPNANLANPGFTIGSVAMSLGGSASSFNGLTLGNPVISGTLVGGGNAPKIVAVIGEFGR